MRLLAALLVGGGVLLLAVLVPLAILAAVLGLLLGLLLVPLKLLGWGVKLGAGLAALAVKGILILAVALALLLGQGLAPLLPIVLLGAGLYLLLRPARRPSPPIVRAR